MKIHKRIFIITVCGLILWSMGVACNRSGMLEESDPEAASVTAAALEDSVTTGGQASEGEASSRPDPAAIEYAQAVQTIAEEAARKQGALTDEMQKKEQMASDVEAHVEEFVKYAEQKYGREAVIDALVERKDAQEATLTTLEAAKADADTAAAGATAEEKEAIDEEAVAAAAATAEQKEADEKEEATLTDEQ